jgi:hypothetical protein
VGGVVEGALVIGRRLAQPAKKNAAANAAMSHPERGNDRKGEDVRAINPGTEVFCGFAMNILSRLRTYTATPKIRTARSGCPTKPHFASARDSGYYSHAKFFDQRARRRCATSRSMALQIRSLARAN